MDIKVLLMIATLFTLFFVVRNIFMIVFSMGNYNIHKKRLQQLKFNDKKKDLEVEDLIDKITQPAIKYILPKIKIKNAEELATDLKLSGWDKYYTPHQYIALNITLKIIGTVLFLLLLKVSLLFAGLWGGAGWFLLPVLFKNTISEKKTKLLSDFPDFIRITSGYLSAKLPFSKAVEESIKYVGDTWKPILQNFVIECETKSVTEALDGLKTSVDMFEVREFVALVKLTLEKGGDVREGFEAQAEKIREMQMNIIEIKVGRRQTMALIIQAPLLLCNLMVFGLPTVYSMVNMSSM